MQDRIVVTGMGIISAIGQTVEENYRALVSHQVGVGTLTLFDSIHKNKIKVGEVKSTTEELIKRLNLPEDNNYTRTALLGVYAAKQAVDQAGIQDINAVHTGLISSTSVGGMDFIEQYYQSFQTDPVVLKYVSSQEAGDSTEKIADYLGLQGYISTISTACSSAANALMMGCRMIKAGKLDRVIVGGTDALSKFTVNGFNTLMILSDTDNTPFDQNRKGLNLGEAAAYLVLEREDVALARNQAILGVVAGYGNANDAYHQTASSEDGEGAFLAMSEEPCKPFDANRKGVSLGEAAAAVYLSTTPIEEQSFEIIGEASIADANHISGPSRTGEGLFLSIQQALKEAQLSADQMDCICAHGTATAYNDEMESIAFDRLGLAQKPIHSQKGYFGHTLGAAGLLELVMLMQSMRHSELIISKGFEQLGVSRAVNITQTAQTQTLQFALKTASGFGGSNTAVILSKK